MIRLETLGHKIKSLRTLLNFSQENLCNEILSRSVLSKIENDKVTPSIYQLQHIADTLNTNMEYFLTSSTDLNDTSFSKYNSSLIYKLYSDKKYNQITINFEKKLIDTSTDINTLFYIGHSYYLTSFYKEAKKILTSFIKTIDSLDLAEQELYYENYSIALSSLAYIYKLNNNIDKTLYYLKKSKLKLEQLNKYNSKIYLIITNNIGSIYNELNRYKDVIDILSPLISTINDCIYINIISHYHLTLNVAYYNVNDYVQSLNHLKKALLLFEYSSDSYYSKNIYLNYINIYRYQEDFNAAFKILDEFKEKYKTESAESYTFILQEAIIYFNIINYDSVISLLKKIKITELKHSSKCNYYFIKGHISFINNDCKSALKYLKKCEIYFEKHSLSYDLKLLYYDLYALTEDDYYKELYLQHLTPPKYFKKNILCTNNINKYKKKPNK